MSDLVGNPEDRFSHNEAQLTLEVPNTTIAEFSSTVDLDETSHNEPSDLDLQCLPSRL